MNIIVIDDEPFIFTPDDYEGLTEEMEEIPYGWYDSNYDIYTSFFTFYFEPAKNVGCLDQQGPPGWSLKAGGRGHCRVSA